MTMQFCPAYTPALRAAVDHAHAARQTLAAGWGYAAAERGPKMRRTKDGGRYVYYTDGSWLLVGADGARSRASAAQARHLNRAGARTV